MSKYECIVTQLSRCEALDTLAPG